MCLLWLSPGGGGLYLVHQSQPYPLSQRLSEVGHGLLPFSHKLGKAAQPFLQGCEAEHVWRWGNKYWNTEMKFESESKSRAVEMVAGFLVLIQVKKRGIPPMLPTALCSWGGDGLLLPFLLLLLAAAWNQTCSFHPAAGHGLNPASEECFTRLHFGPLSLPRGFICDAQAFANVATQLSEADQHPSPLLIITSQLQSPLLHLVTWVGCWLTWGHLLEVANWHLLFTFLCAFGPTFSKVFEE